MMQTCSVCSPYTKASFQAVQDGVKHTRKARHVRVYNQRPAQSSYTASQEWKSANPGFDDIELDEDYYQSLGLSEEELADQLAFLANDADPMGEDLGPEGLDKQQLGASSYLMDEDMNEATWGPQAILLAGFKAEECAIIRCILDSAGSDLVKVIPCTSDMLYLSVENGMNEPEVDWSQPRPDNWGRGREWGSQRVILFSGLSGGTVLTIVELLEEAGLPPLCIAMAEEEDADRVVGEVLAEAVKAQRGRKTPQKHLWELPGHAGRRLPDLEELIGSQARARTQVVQGQQQPPQQQQFTEEPASSSTSFHPSAAEPLQADAGTGSSSHTTEVRSSVPGATEAASQHQHQHQHQQPSTAANWSSERELTDAAQAADVVQSGATSSEDLRASQHTAAMAPGIDALRKRRAAVQQQPLAQDAAYLSEELPQQVGEHRAAVHHDSVTAAKAAAASTAAPTSLPDDQMPTAAQEAGPLQGPYHTPTAPHQGHQTGLSQDQAPDLSRQTTQPLGTKNLGTLQTGNANGHHADDVRNLSGSAQEDQQPTWAETSGVQGDYDSLLDAIAAGELDWEAPAAEQSPNDQASIQQPGSNQQTQTMVEQSLQATADQTSSEQLTRREQVEATPSNSADNYLKHATAAAAGDLGSRPATANSGADKPGPTHQQISPESGQQPEEAQYSQQTAEAQSIQDPVRSEQSQKPVEAAEQAWPWESSRAAADSPTLSADVVARSSSRLRLRRASSSLHAQKQAGRTKKSDGKTKTLSDLLKSKSRRPSSQGAMQETKWRVTNSQQTTAEEFVKPPADIDSQRPVWAASAASAAQPVSGTEEEAARHEGESKRSAPPSESRPLTKQELWALAARRGLDYQRLLADAVSRGIPVSD